MEPQFKINDIVTFELMEGITDSSRWDFNNDRGGSGQWATGKVIDVRDNEIYVETNHPNGIWAWWWPAKGDKEYDPSQWHRDGYLRHVKKYDAHLIKQAEMTVNGTSIQHR